jgi:hypothetical protein
MERPRYRVLAEKAVIKSVYARGSEVEFLGWPKATELEPVNDAAHKVAAYYLKNRTHPILPKSPYNHDLREIYLPAVLPPWAPITPHSDPGLRLQGLVPLDQGDERMPRYRSPFRQPVGSYEVEEGAEFYFLGWPASGFLAVNAAAEEVAIYLDYNAKNPARLSSPWCEFKRSLVLPQLPPMPAMPGVAA